MATGPVTQRVDFLKGFACIGAECEDTCCHGWSMQVDPVRRKAYAAMPALQVGAVVETPTGPVMKRDETSQLCLQLRGGMCSIHATHGSDLLTDACHFYPRVVREVGGDIHVSAVMSCPEVARLALYGDAPVTLSRGSLERLPVELNRYAEEVDAFEAAGAITATLDLVEQAGDVGRALVHLREMAATRPAYAWPRRPIQLIETEQPAPHFAPGDVQRVVQVLAGLLHNADAFPGPRLVRMVKDMTSALKIRIDPRSLDIYGSPSAMAVAGVLNASWPTLAARLRRPLRRWLQTQLLASSFPWAGLGALPIDKVYILGMKFAVLRLALLTSLPVGDTGPVEVTRVAQTVSRALDHLSQGEIIVSLMRQMGWLEPANFRGLVGDS